MYIFSSASGAPSTQDTIAAPSPTPPPSCSPSTLHACPHLQNIFLLCSLPSGLHLQRSIHFAKQFDPPFLGSECPFGGFPPPFPFSPLHRPTAPRRVAETPPREPPPCGAGWDPLETSAVLTHTFTSFALVVRPELLERGGWQARPRDENFLREERGWLGRSVLCLLSDV